MTYQPTTHAFARAPLYETVLDLLGPTAIVVPIGDSDYESAGRTTVTTAGKEQAVFTYSEAVTAFDTAPTYKGPGRIPVVTFNGTDEEADSPDATYWSRGDGATDSPFSIGAWVNLIASGSGRHIICKWTNDDNKREWRLYVTADDHLEFRLYDQSVSASPARQANSVITNGVWHFYSVTYDGSGGATAADGITMYAEGADASGAAENKPTYVAMENLTSLVAVGMRPTTAFFKGSMAGGPLGPFFVQRELSADEILRLYKLGGAALNELT